jgi:hypothetical protein
MALWTVDDIDKLFFRVNKLEQDHAAQERLIEEIRLSQHQNRDEGGQASEASNCNCPGHPTQSQGQKAKERKITTSIESPDGIYIAGPMTGHPNHNFDEFFRVAGKLRRAGYRVVNPAELNPDKPSYPIAMRRDIAQMLTCDTIMLLPGWERSDGAFAEFHIARILQMSFLYWELECSRYK